MTLTDHPRAYATVTGDDAIYTGTDGHREHLTDAADIRREVLRRATDEARLSGSPVELVTRGDRGDHRLLIGHDGTLTPVDHRPVDRGPADGVKGSSDLPESRTSDVANTRTPERPKGRDPEVPDSDTQPATRRPPRRHTQPSAAALEIAPPSVTRTSFIDPATTHHRPVSGWRALLARLGLRMAPSAYELARGEWVQAVSRQWAGCRTIAVVNGKGGVGKTMTSAMLAAVLARNGGGSVLAWDNNDTRGTLGWRTEQGAFDTTIRDVLPAAPDLLAATASVSDIAEYVHHQTADRYDVLRSNPELLATDQRIDAGQFDLLMKVAARYYRLVVFDSGNDESADRWIRMIDSTRQLVIPTLATPESAESAALLLEALRHRDESSARLAENAVIVVTQSEPGSSARVQQIADGFTGWVRAVETVPFDPALKSGALRLDDLRPVTRDAWLRVAAAASDGL